MSTKCASPTANLLRQSRLFSLPPPLPPSSSEGSLTRFSSPSSTAPYPSHAAITTPESSRSRGDWGLKRNLPLKTTATTSTPVINVEELDTLYHITEFSSAAYHTTNLQKWQSMNIPLSTRPLRETYSAIPSTKVDDDAQSVFESKLDQTAPGVDRVNRLAPRRRSQAQRWKFKGPWLVGKSESEFKMYVDKDIAERRQEFYDYLQVKAAEELQSKRRRDEMEHGFVNDTEAPSISAKDVSDDDLGRFVRRLRNNKSQMDQLVTDFLDLPATEDHSGASSSLFARNGPPLTHPSAGLSYLRSPARIRNHPVFGPQAELSAPVEARVLSPRQSRDRPSAFTAKLGVAGFVADDVVTNTGKGIRARNNETPGVRHFDAKIPGGAKVWVNPSSAYIDATGKVMLGISRSQAIDVEISEIGRAQGSPAASTDSNGPEDQPSSHKSQSVGSNGGNAGLGAHSYRQRPDIKPFSDVSSAGGLEELRRIVNRETR